MSVNHQETTPEQSAGFDPKSPKRNSGLFNFFKWFKPSASRESVNSDVPNSPHSSSCDSLSSIQSGGTVASFSFVPPNAYSNKVAEKCITPGPETDTYKARLKQRDKCRENDKNLTLRQKYNLFFHKQPEESTKSLPLMTKTAMDSDDDSAKVGHRRTNSESSKLRKAGSYLHVKGKRRAPQPPGGKSYSNPSTMSLKRKKRLAPLPPEKLLKGINKETDVICNDSLKLERGMLKPAKEEAKECKDRNSGANSARSSYVEAPVSPRPWYKRNTSKECVKKDKDKYDLPETQIMRNSTLDLTLEEAVATTKKDDKKKEDKRKSGISYLTNISELDREASEIIKKEKNGYDLQEIPEFMRPKEDPKINTDSWISPKRRSARDLIAKFNAITNVTKVTVFGTKDNKRDYFGKQHSLEENKRQETLLDAHKKRIEQIDKKHNDKFNILMKSESANAIKSKPDTPKLERKNWNCGKCNVENEYWRIICHVCSTIKPYFDDFYSNKQNEGKEVKTTSPLVERKITPPSESPDKVLERSKTQIGFSALANYNANRKTSPEKTQKELEKEKLKRMLIEMKNSLPKRKSNMLIKQNSRASIIIENPEPEVKEKQPEIKEKTQEEKVAEILIGTQETIYENIKVKKTDNPKPVKVSSSAQTSAVVKKIVPPNTITNLIKSEEANKRNNYELMRPKDFEDIYSDKNAKSAARIYANLAQSDELSLFFNVPKKINDLKNNLSQADVNTDTIEINRLLRRLETAIAKGDLTEAAIFAKELAQLKVNCSVIRQKGREGEGAKPKKTGFQIEMYVEDKISHRGPFPIQVTENQTVAELKRQIEREFEIPVNVQRWILGKELVTNDNGTLKDHHVTTDGCPVFLYLVAPDAKANSEKRASQLVQTEEQPSTSKDTKVEKQDDKILETEPIKPKIVKVIPKIVDNSPKTDVIVETKEVTVNETNKPKDNKIVVPITEYKSRTQPAPLIDPKLVKKTVADVKFDTKPIEKVVVVETNVKKGENVVTKTKIEQTVVQTPTASGKIQEKTVVVKTEEKSIVDKNVGNNTTSTSSVQEAIPSTSAKEPQKAVLEDDFEEYDSRTLKPQSKEWECHLCTLLNPISTNVCGVCASVRLKTQPPKKSVKLKRAPQPKDQTYLQLVNLDNADLVENQEPFECVVCFLEIPPKEGVTLRECLHQFCKLCLAHTIEYSEEAEVKCPYRDDEYSCNIALQDREIKALVKKDVYDQYLAKSIAQAENKIDKSFHCKTPDCKGWCIFEDNVNEFRCPVCRKTNCMTCQAIHMGVNCKQYQERMKDDSETDENAKRTKEMLDEMVNKGEALTCPTCKVILMKKWGCDWLRCSMCKTEICWVTRGPRWGPAGKGDTSGGCQCGVNGVKCHPKCNYCH